jgi:hypothetical protein
VLLGGFILTLMALGMERRRESCSAEQWESGLPVVEKEAYWSDVGGSMGPMVSGAGPSVSSSVQAGSMSAPSSELEEPELSSESREDSLWDGVDW